MDTKNTLAGKGESEQQIPVPPQQPTGEAGLRATGSQLISFGDRVTYTFPFGKEIGSIHFDKARGEIFFKGHNIRNMELEERQMQVLEQLREVLKEKEEGTEFVEPYGHTLDKVIFEKRNRQNP